jgi:hypothetical protein
MRNAKLDNNRNDKNNHDLTEDRTRRIGISGTYLQLLFDLNQIKHVDQIYVNKTNWLFHPYLDFYCGVSVG